MDIADSTVSPHLGDDRWAPQGCRQMDRESEASVVKVARCRWLAGGRSAECADGGCVLGFPPRRRIQYPRCPWNAHRVDPLLWCQRAANRSSGGGGTTISHSTAWLRFRPGGARMAFSNEREALREVHADASSASTAKIRNTPGPARSPQSTQLENRNSVGRNSKTFQIALPEPSTLRPVEKSVSFGELVLRRRAFTVFFPFSAAFCCGVRTMSCCCLL